jgi:hypothetical protein
MTHNINTLTFENHDTYIYYPTDWFKNEQIVYLTPTNPEDTDIVRYSSDDVDLFSNGVKSGVLKSNDFIESKLNSIFDSIIYTIITDDGILMYNVATELNSTFLGINDSSTKNLATYKSGKYANYINVEIQTYVEDGYRIITISY